MIKFWRQEICTYYTVVYFDLIINFMRKENAVMKKVTVKVVKPATDKSNVQCCTCGIIS